MNHLTTLREVREALAAIVKSLSDQDDEGLIEHAQQMIDARAALTNLDRLISEVEAAEPVAKVVDTRRGFNTVSYISGTINAIPAGTQLYTHPHPTGFNAATAAADGFRDGVASVAQPTSEAGLPPLPEPNWHTPMAFDAAHFPYFTSEEMQSYAREAVAQAVEAYRVDAERLRDALHQISLCSQNSMSSQRECGEIARKALGTEYNEARIAWELERTALGDGFYGNALRVAKDIAGVTDADRALLDRYATGKQRGTDHVALQELALRIADIRARGQGGAA